MLEMLFTAGAALQIALIHTKTWRHLHRLFLLGGVIVTFSILIGLCTAFPILIDPLFTSGMVLATLWAMTLGLFSMTAAPSWSFLRLSLFFLGVVSLLVEARAYDVWIWTGALGAACALVMALPFLGRSTLFHALLYALALIMAIALEILYILPMMQIVSPDPLTIFFSGALFFSLGTTGFFTIKYLTMVLATIGHRDQYWRHLLQQWLQNHLSPVTKSELRKLAGILTITTVSTFIASPHTAALLGITLLLSIK